MLKTHKQKAWKARAAWRIIIADRGKCPQVDCGGIGRDIRYLGELNGDPHYICRVCGFDWKGIS